MTATTTIDTTISKSARKKLQKIYDAHVKRHEKWKLKQEHKHKHKQKPDSKANDDGVDGDGDGDDLQEVEQGQSKTRTEAGIPNSSENDETKKTTTLDPSFVQFVAGSFGKRQGLELFSDMGPFCHIVDI